MCETKMTTSYIYILQTREFIGKNVYKIGRTEQENLKRFHQYPKGSILLFLLDCKNCRNIEGQVKILFKEQFKHRKDLGNEYFEGDYYIMRHIIYNEVCNEDCNEVCNEICNEDCNEVCNEICNEICNEVCNEICNEICNEDKNNDSKFEDNTIEDNFKNDISDIDEEETYEVKSYEEFIKYGCYHRGSKVDKVIITNKKKTRRIY